MGNLMVVHKLADKSAGDRVVRYDPVTGEKKLVNPATPGDEHEPWPLLGVELVDPPDTCVVSVGWMTNAARERWLTRENPRVVNRPLGPADNPELGYHQFVHVDGVTIRTVDGDVHYRVTRQPDKYATDADGNVLGDDEPVTGEHYAAGHTAVDWTYHLERDNG